VTLLTVLDLYGETLEAQPMRLGDTACRGTDVY
jgi:hypothetical protein